VQKHQIVDTSTTRLHAALEALDWPLLTRLCRQTLRKQPRNLSANRFLGFSLSKQRKTDDALSAYRKALVHWPDDGELLANFGNFLIERGRNAEALPLLERLCKIRPDKAVCWNELAHCYYAECQHEKGLAAAEKAAELADDLLNQVTALTQKAIHRRELGQIKEAVRDCETAIALMPIAYGNHTNRLLFMLSEPETDIHQLVAAAREYAAVFELPLKHQWPQFVEHRSRPWRKLKVGFLSPDLRGHPVMYSLEGVLAQLDRRQFEIYALYLYPKEDNVTQRVRNLVDQFVTLSGMEPPEQAKVIHDLGIDIVIDLAGHTGNNGLLTLMRKPAPVQVSWLGFPATTGLSAIDYKITDEVTDPIGADDQYSEKLFRIPTLFACYRPHCREPLWRYQPAYLVRPAPALANGFVTFGCCNNLGKLTDNVLSVWGRLLQKLPTARLLIEGKNLENANFQNTYRDRCQKLGIPTDRLELVALNASNQYLTYHRIDIALDPFPLTGGTTTFDLLWMGLPLVSMIGDAFKSRISTGILSYLNRTEWLAKNEAEYIEIAMRLATNPSQLNAMRLAQRDVVERSPLMDEPRFTHLFGSALREMWLRWLAKSAHPEDARLQQATIKQWQAEVPTEWRHSAKADVGIATGKRMTLNQAHQHLQDLLEIAKQKEPLVNTTSGLIQHQSWKNVVEFAETILSSIPNEPLALACLAEVEQTHGHTDFAVTYLRYAQQAIAKGT